MLRVLNRLAGEGRSGDRKEGRKAPLAGEILFFLYGVFKRGSIRRLIRYIVLRIEGGGHYSVTIRRIMAVYHKVEIGMYTNGPCEYPQNYPPGVRIGRYSSIYDTVKVFNVNHPMNLRSTHALFFNPRLGYAGDDCIREGLIERTDLVIGNDVWIGHNVIILAHVKRVGDGAVIGAGSVVTKDVPDFAVAVGNPARVIRYRFSERTRSKVKESRWWDKDIKELVEKMEEFSCPMENETVRVDANYVGSRV